MRAELKRARIKAGFTQQQLAVRVGVSQQTVSKHERGITTPAQFKLMREYAKMLGVGAEAIFMDVFKD